MTPAEPRGRTALTPGEAEPGDVGVKDKLSIVPSSGAAELLPSVGPQSSCTLKAEHPNAESVALMAYAALVLCGSVSHTSRQKYLGL